MSAPKPTQYSGAEQFAWLDWMRFLAALIVLLTHARGIVFQEYSELTSDSKGLFTAAFFGLTRAGHEAVLIFFVLSGYLVGGKLIERVLKGDFSWRGYLCDRASRIFVPLVPAVLLSFLVGRLLRAPDDGWNAMANLLALQGVVVGPLSVNGPLWSLSYEVWFYVLGGASAVVALRRGGWRAQSLLLLALSVFLYLDPVYLFAWLLGAFAYRMSFGVIRFWYVVVCLLAVALLAGLSQLTSRTNSGVDFGFVDRRLVEICLAAAVASLVNILISMRERAFVSPAFAFLGGRLASFSYSMYLVHFPFLMILKWLGLGRSSAVTGWSVFVFISVVLASMAFSLVFYFLFERNTWRVRRRMRDALGAD